MLNRLQLALGGLSAAFTLLIAVGSAGAEPLLVEPAGIRTTWSSMTFSSRAVTVRCPVTLEGSFNAETLRPTVGAVVGRVTRATVAEASCSGGTARFLSGSLPWNIEFQGFTGTTPEITGVQLELIDAALQATAGGVTCLYQSSGASPMKGTATIRSGAVEVTGLRADETASIPLVSREILCQLGGNGRVAGTGSVTDASGRSEVDVALLNEYAPVTFDRTVPIYVPSDTHIVDVTVEASSARSTGTLDIVGRNRDRFDVSEGCDRRPIGPNPTPRTCRITVSNPDPREPGRPPLRAFLQIPIDGLHRLAQVEN